MREPIKVQTMPGFECQCSRPCESRQRLSLLYMCKIRTVTTTSQHCTNTN